MIHLYTGDGKGKTSAALGLVMRSAGNGLNVCFAQFLKSSPTGELKILEQIPNVTVLRSQKVFGFYQSMTEEEKNEVCSIHNDILDKIIDGISRGKYDIIVLDEITYPIAWKLCDETKVDRIIQLCAQKDGSFPELVITGMMASQKLIEAADYHSSLQAVKHPYSHGLEARRGIEF